jgi:hypothetical protein
MLKIKLIPLIIALVILAGLGGLVYLGINKANEYSQLTPIEYTGTFNKETSFMDELLGKDIVYSFTANTGEVFTLEFKTSHLDQNSTYKLVFKPCIFGIFGVISTRDKSAQHKQINGYWYQLESIIKL